jgi:hypothetical protein
MINSVVGELLFQCAMQNSRGCSSEIVASIERSCEVVIVDTAVLCDSWKGLLTNTHTCLLVLD